MQKIQNQKCLNKIKFHQNRRKMKKNKSKINNIKKKSKKIKLKPPHVTKTLFKLIQIHKAT